MMKLSRRLIIPALIGLMTMPVLSACGSEPPAPDGTTIYLVRHAEKMKGADPRLTEAGQARSQAIVARLAGEPVDFIHSTNTRRTLETAAPLSEARDIAVQIYDGKDLSAIADKIRMEPGTHVVIGHSNTTPQLAGLISGQVMEVMPETEYNRLTRVKLKASGELDGVDVTTFGAE